MIYEKYLHNNKMITLTYLKFYSGIVSWDYTVEQTCCSIQVAAISPVTAAASLIAAEPLLHPEKLKFANSNVINKDRSHTFGTMKLHAELPTAFDHSDLCNSVFYHSHASFLTASQPSNRPSYSKPFKWYKPNQTPNSKPNPPQSGASPPHVNLIVETSLIY